MNKRFAYTMTSLALAAVCVAAFPQSFAFAEGGSTAAPVAPEEGQAESAAADGQDMYRLYNPNMGEHFYTADAGERDGLVEEGWRYEGVAWVSPTKSKTPVYRLYSGTDHHYTTSKEERKALKAAGWTYEGIGWYSDDEERIELYRQFNPHVNIHAWHNNSGSHNYTTSDGEAEALVNAGWKDEGVAWYAVAEGALLDPPTPTAKQLWAELDIAKDFRKGFAHGFKGADWQGYIVLHDTEEADNAQSVVDMWDKSGNGIATHFVVDRDGSIIQCVKMDKIAHHAGAGTVGNDAKYGTTDHSRDDVPAWDGDYGMNSYSIGIEICHVGGKEGYTAAQLKALDGLIAYIDAYYGFESPIIDHKMWRATNSDTSKEFAQYLKSYRTYRRHAKS